MSNKIENIDELITEWKKLLNNTAVGQAEIRKLFNTTPEKQNNIKQRKQGVEHNQYFTRNDAVQFALDLIKDEAFENVIDPVVVGSNFIETAKRYWEMAKFFGIDIEERFKTAPFGSIDENSLEHSIWDFSEIKKIMDNGGFDLVIGNPPFSNWFDRISDKDVIDNYSIVANSKSVSIEVLFIELFIRIVKNDGYIIIVLPDGMLGNSQNKFVRDFIIAHCEVKHIIDLPRSTSQNTSAKTSILILQKKEIISSNYDVLFHNYQNKLTFKKQLADIKDRFDYNNVIANTPNNMNFPTCALTNYVVEFKTGKTKYGKDREFVDVGEHFLHATNITELGIDYNKDEKYISKNSKMYNELAMSKIDDILFVRVGAGCAGRVTIVDEDSKNGVVTDYIFIIRVKEINPYFLTLYLNTNIGQNAINKLKHGVGAVSINKKELLNIEIPIIENQNSFGEMYKSVLLNKDKTGLEQSKIKLENYLSNYSNN
jgi:type I restriction-modification system DNA methylase subunit